MGDAYVWCIILFIFNNFHFTLSALISKKLFFKCIVFPLNNAVDGFLSFKYSALGLAHLKNVIGWAILTWYFFKYIIVGSKLMLVLENYIGSDRMQISAVYWL